MLAGKCLCGVVRYAAEAPFLYAGYSTPGFRPWSPGDLTYQPTRQQHGSTERRK